MPDWRLAAGVLAFLLVSGAFGATTMDLGRPYGYVVGDIVTQSVTFDHQHGRIDPASLPEPGYQTHWLYLRSADLSGPVGDQNLTLSYQIMSSAHDVTLIYLPVVKLKTDRGDERIDAVPISVSAITSKEPMQVQGMGDLQADQLVAAPDTGVPRKLLWLALPLLLLVGAGLLFRSHWLKRAGQALPFAHARRQIRQLRRTGQTDGQQLRQAHQQLHRAFDASAGRRLFAEGVDDFVGQAPQFANLHEEITRFFDSSSRLFFGQARDQDAETALLDMTTLGKLAERLAGIERSNL